MATKVMAAHRRQLYDRMNAARKPINRLKFATLQKERNMNTLGRRQEFLRICIKKDLAEKAQEIEMTKPVEKNQETRHSFDAESYFMSHF